MGARVSRTEFDWIYTDEPHASRRKEILKKYPQIKNLFGPDPRFKWIVFGLIFLQLSSLTLIENMSWPVLICFAYCFGGVINHALLMAIHEIAHGLAFGHGRPTANKLLGIIANLPIGIPIYVPYKQYHLEHHRYQGDEVLDTDNPTELEARLFCTTGGKMIWLFFQPLFYFIRQKVTRPIPLTPMEIFNIILQLSFDYAVFQFFGFKTLFYLLAGSWLAMGIHPVAGHFLTSHFMFAKGNETNSYYGPLNLLTFNIGYHNEHHDFPAVPWSKLPEVTKIAPEYYKTIPHQTSWLKAFYRFITDPEMGFYSRIKRKSRLMAKSAE